MSEAEFILFLQQICSLFARHSYNGSLHYLFIDWRHVGELLTAAKGVYSELKNIAVWVKSTPGMGSLYRSQHELVAIFKSAMAPTETISSSVNSGGTGAMCGHMQALGARARKEICSHFILR